MKVIAYCHECRHQHVIDFDPLRPTNDFSDWYAKHPGHFGVGFDWPQRSTKPLIYDRVRSVWRWIKQRFIWGVAASPILLSPEPSIPPALVGYLHNANVKLAYAASAAYTIAIQTTPLASSSTFTTGRQGTAVTNSSNLYLDYLIGGKVTTGTTPTAGEIRVYLYASRNDTPTYEDTLTGTDADITITSTDILGAVLRLAASSTTNTTSNRTYPFVMFSLASFFGGVCPRDHGLYVAHNTVAALNATGSNHAFSQTGVYATVV